MFYRSYSYNLPEKYFAVINYDFKAFESLKYQVLRYSLLIKAHVGHNLHKNSQTVKKVRPMRKKQQEKSCEIKGDGVAVVVV